MLSIPLAIIFWQVGPMLRLFHQQENLVALVQPYFHVLAFSIVPFMLYISFIQFVTGLGKSKIVLYFASVNTLLMLSIGYALLFGKFGLPKMGMVGMAYANAIVFFCGFFMSLAYLRFCSDCKNLQVFKFVKEDLEYFKKILQLGIPISIQFISELTAFAFATIMIGWVGQTSLAASQIVMQLNMIAIMGPFGIMQASGVLIGKALGSGNKQATSVYGSAGLLSGLVFTLIVAFVYLLFPKLLISFYSVNIHDIANLKLIHIAVILFAIGAVSQVFDGLRAIITGALRGFHDSVTPMWVGVIASWIISIPLGYVLGFWLHLGAPGISAGFLFAWIIGSAVLIQRFYKKARS
jgi:MATE family multidrug resistance protein